MSERPIVILTPWYPSAEHPYSGAFVRSAARAVSSHFKNLHIVHAEVGHVSQVVSEPCGEFPLTQVRYAPGRFPSRLTSARALGAALRQLDSEILSDAALVHVHTGFPAGHGLVSLLPPDVPLLLTEHASYLADLLTWPATRNAYGALARRAGAITTPSTGLGALLAGNMPRNGSATPVLRVPNVIEIAEAGIGGPQKAELREGSGPGRWITVGNLTPTKRIDLVIRAFGYAQELREAHQLTVVGQGKDLGRLVKLVRRLRLAGAVNFTGSLDGKALATELARHSLYVHTSAQETFGIAALEAAAAGLAVVATATVGARETMPPLVELGAAAVVPLDVSVVELAKAAITLERSASSSARKASAAQVAQRYGAAAVGLQFAKIYQALIDRAGETLGDGVGLEAQGAAGLPVGLEQIAAGPGLTAGVVWRSRLRQFPRYLPHPR